LLGYELGVEHISEATRQFEPTQKRSGGPVRNVPVFVAVWAVIVLICGVWFVVEVVAAVAGGAA
jgi:hypothetical protein